MTADDWSKCGPTVLAAFEMRGEHYELPWMIAEYRRLMGQRKVRSEAGRKRADNRWQKDGNAMAEPKQSHAKTQNPKTRNLITEVESEKENQRGFGGNGDPPPADEPRVFDSFFSSSSGVTGSRTLDSIEWEKITALRLFPLLQGVFVFAGVRDARELHRLADKAGVSPARWTMLFFDKIGYAYGQVDGKCRVDVEEADAVALTAAGFKPKKGAPQAPTESACRLFKEIIFDLVGNPESKRWRPLSAPAIAVELAKRKGKRAS
jgi:hypothetical protein